MTDAAFADRAAELQKAYRTSRKAYAKSIGRPYARRPVDLRPPPGELDLDDSDLPPILYPRDEPMTEVPAPAAPSASLTMPMLPSAGSPLPNWLETILSVLLMGAGAGLVKSHLLTNAQLAEGVSAILVLLSLVMTVFNAMPNKTSLIGMVLGLVAKSGQAASYDQAVGQAEAAGVKAVEKIADAQIHAKAGILAGPLDDVANAVISQGAAAGEAAVEAPLTQPSQGA